MTVRNHVCAAALTAALVLSSCSSTSDGAASSTTTTPDTLSSAAPATGPTGSSTTPPPASKAAPTSDRELEALLVTAVPAGFVLQADDVGDTGPSDLAKAVRDDPSPGVEEALRKEGFVRGYQRLWVGPDDQEVIVFVYQFATVAGAQADFERAKPELTEQAPPGAAPFPVEGLPADRTAALAATSEDGAAAVVLFTSGVYNVQVVCNATSMTGLQERVSAIARDQHARL